VPLSSTVNRGRAGSATSEIFPAALSKPADATYPPFLGPFTRSQHLTGPWQPIRQREKDNAQSLRHKSAASGG
jgi:hypothetical protein